MSLLVVAFALWGTATARADLFGCPTLVARATETVGSAAAAISPAASLPRSLQIPFHFAVQPVLDEGGRGEHARISVGGDRDMVIIESPAGRYEISFTDDPTKTYPRQGLPEVHVRNGRAYARLVIYRSDVHTMLERVQGRVRSAFRADPYLHPHLKPPGWVGPLRLSYPQKEALDALIAMEETGRGFRRGLSMPVAMGKTVVAAKYVAAIGQLLRDQRRARGWTKPTRVLFVVENTHVLDRSVETFVDELGFTNIAKVYGDERDRWDRNAQMIAITRSSYHNRRNEIHELLGGDPDQPWVIVFDEAHHVGKRDGQFARIQRDLARVMDHRHRELNLSPFFYHRDRVLVRQHLLGNVWGAFLNESEHRHLRAGRHLVDLVRAQYYRGMMLGYLSPVFGLTMVRQVGGAPAIDLLGPQRPVIENGVSRLRWSPALLDDVATRLQGSRQAGVVDRGVFFVDSRERATLYARELSERLGVDVRALHSGDEIDEETYDWFADRGRFATNAERRRPKYIVVVDMLREGVDIPSINIIFLMRRYGSDMAGFGNLLQTIGRGNRLHSRFPQLKPALRVFDYTLYTRWLRLGLSAISVEAAPVHWGRSGPPASYIVVDDELLDPAQFESRYLELFPEDATFVNRYPFYDQRRFVAEAVPEIYRQALYMRIPDWSHGSAPRALAIALAEGLSPSPEKDDLLERLRGDWGWRAHDGSQLNQGIPAVCHRFYEALHEIAVLFELSPEGEDFDVDTVHTGAGVRALMDRLLPSRQPLDVGRARWFLEPDSGALGFLVDATRLRFDSRAHTIRDQLRWFASLLPETSEERARILQDLEPGGAYGILDEDGMRERRLTPEQILALTADPYGAVWSYNRIHRVWADIGRAWNASHPEAPVDLSRIHARYGAERLAAAMNATRGEEEYLDDERFARFLDDATGGLAALRDRISNFGTTQFTTNFGPREIALGAAALVPNEAERTRLLADLRRRDLYAWLGNDGALIQGQRSGSVRRFYAALYRVARAFVRSRRGIETVPAEIHTRRGMEIFLDELFLGFALPSFTPELAARMRAADGLLSIVRSLAAEYVVDDFYRRFGLHRLVVGIADELGNSQWERRFRELVRHPKLWEWKKLDGTMLFNGDAPSLFRLFRAVTTIARLGRLAHGSTVTDTQALTAAGFRRLLYALRRN